MKRVYLDTCVWCRPFDAQTSKRIRFETEAFFEIASLVDAGRLEIASSESLIAELNYLPDREKRNLAIKLVEKACTHEVPLNEKMRSLAEDIEENCGLSGPDSLQMASALFAESDVFVTTDDFIIKREECIKQEFGILVSNPTDFVEEYNVGGRN